MDSQQRRILLFTGNGKGKSTAAFGMLARALGHGMTAAVIQFVKSDSEESGHGNPSCGCP
jgi:cob(I)alamin adenosyltransferase